MGIQLKVKREDLPTEWKVEQRVEVVGDHRCLMEHCPYCGGDGCTMERKRLWVEFPKSGWAMSYLEDELLIDNKDANHQFREELEEWGVPYTRG